MKGGIHFWGVMERMKLASGFLCNDFVRSLWPNWIVQPPPKKKLLGCQSPLLMLKGMEEIPDFKIKSPNVSGWVIDNGNSISLWFRNWHPSWPLSEQWSSRERFVWVIPHTRICLLIGVQFWDNWRQLLQLCHSQGVLNMTLVFGSHPSRSSSTKLAYDALRVPNGRAQL